MAKHVQIRVLGRAMDRWWVWRLQQRKRAGQQNRAGKADRQSRQSRALRVWFEATFLVKTRAHLRAAKLVGRGMAAVFRHWRLVQLYRQGRAQVTPRSGRSTRI